MDGATLPNKDQRVEARDLPSIIDGVGQRLAEARSSAEVLEAKRQAEAALHYSKVCKAANETQADCIRMIVRAEMRMADEIDRGQAEGEVAKRNQPVSQYVQNADIPHPTITLDELGVSRQRIAEWRRIRDAGQEVAEDAINGALAQGRAPTKSDIKRAADEATRPQPELTPTPTPQPTTPRGEAGAERDNSHHRTNFTGENEWYTPKHYVHAARRVLGAIDLDPASSQTAQERIGAGAYFTEDDDGLAQDWHGRVWLNPPYSQPSIAHFCDKVVAEWMAGNIDAAIVLTHNYTDTRWFHTLFGAATAICFTRGRVKFVNQNGEEAAPSQGQAFTYFGNDVTRFAAEFSQYGRIVSPMAEVAA